MVLEQSLTGRPRTRLRTLVLARDTHCHLCGYPVDKQRDPQRDPLGAVVDEVLPRHHGGSAVDPTNCRLAHRVCNGSRGTKQVTVEVRARCRSLVEALTHATPTLRRW